MDSPSPRDEPQRLSNLYQYHNAPEVAPAHGLEYDDTVYPVSDKYPVVREASAYDGKSRSKYDYVSDNRPPRIIFGMKVRTFLCVAAVMTVIVVGAAVGGALGGQQLRDAQETALPVPIASSSSSPTSTASNTASTTSTFAAAIPTYIPLSDCPQSNNTLYTSSFSQTSSDNAPSDTGLRFTKHCDLANPLTREGAVHIAEAFVYSFSDCIEVCAGYNRWNSGSNCTIAVYQPDASRPGNCFVGRAAEGITAQQLAPTEGTEVAFLKV